MQRWRFLVLSIVCLWMSACGQATPTPTAVPPTAEPPAATATQPLPTRVPIVATRPAHIRIINAMAGGSSLTVKVGFLTVASNLASGQLTQSVEIDSGDYTLRATMSGANADDPALLEKSITLNGDETVMLILTGDTTQPDLLSLPETIQPLNGGESIVTAINVVQGVNTLHLLKDNLDLIPGITFGQQATSAIFPAGSSTVQLTNDGTPLLDYPLDLKERQAYTLIVGGSAADPIAMNFAENAPSRTSVRAINGSAEIPAMDIYLDDQLLVANAAYARPTEPQNFRSGSYSLSVYTAGADKSTAEPINTQSIELNTEGDLTLVILGTPDDLRAVIYKEDVSPTPPGKARIAFLNTLPTFPGVQLATSGGRLPDLPDPRYGDAPVVTTLDAGTFSFFFTGVDQGGINTTVEVVENVQLEQGRNYLYLITGRLDNNPIILSDNVGIDESVVVEDGAVVQPSAGATVHFINAIADGSVIDFAVGDTVLASNIAYGQGSDLITVGQRSPTFSMRQNGTDSSAASIDAQLTEGGQYTVIAYGASLDRSDLLLLSDDQLRLDPNTPHLRLINVSDSTDIMLGIGFAEVTQVVTSEAPQAATAEATGEVEPDDGRQSIPFGIQQIVNNIGGGSASNIILMAEGTFDLMVLDSASNTLATTLRSITLEAGAHYDVIAYQEINSPRVQAFIVTYPGG